MRWKREMKTTKKKRKDTVEQSREAGPGWGWEHEDDECWRAENVLEAYHRSGVVSWFCPASSALDCHAGGSGNKLSPCYSAIATLCHYCTAMRMGLQHKEFDVGITHMNCLIQRQLK